MVWLADVWPADDIPICSIFTYFQYSLIHDLAHNALTYKTVCDNGKFCKWVDFDLKWVVSAKLQTIEQQLSWTASLLSQGSNLRGSQFECCNSRQIRVYSSFVNLKFLTKNILKLRKFSKFHILISTSSFDQVSRSLASNHLVCLFANKLTFYLIKPSSQLIHIKLLGLSYN